MWAAQSPSLGGGVMSKQPRLDPSSFKNIYFFYILYSFWIFSIQKILIKCIKKCIYLANCSAIQMYTNMENNRQSTKAVQDRFKQLMVQVSHGSGFKAQRSIYVRASSAVLNTHAHTLFSLQHPVVARAASQLGRCQSLPVSCFLRGFWLSVFLLLFCFIFVVVAFLSFCLSFSCLVVFVLFLLLLCSCVYLSGITDQGT